MFFFPRSFSLSDTRVGAGKWESSSARIFSSAMKATERDSESKSVVAPYAFRVNVV